MGKIRRTITLAIFQVITSGCIIIYWSIIIIGEVAPDNTPPGFYEFTYALLVPSMLLMIMLLFSGISLFMERVFARTLSLVSAGALLVIGIAGASYNLVNGVYVVSAFYLIFYSFIDLWSIILGIWIILTLGRGSG